VGNVRFTIVAWIQSASAPFGSSTTEYSVADLIDRYPCSEASPGFFTTEYMGSGSWVAGMDGGAFDQMVAPDPGEQKWPGERAADSAWIVLYSEFTEMLWADAGGFRVIPAAANRDGGIRGGHDETIPSRDQILAVKPMLRPFGAGEFMSSRMADKMAAMAASWSASLLFNLDSRAANWRASSLLDDSNSRRRTKARTT
jgi:hypothetical protein